MHTNMCRAIPQMTQIGNIGNALDAIESRLAELERHGALDKSMLSTPNPPGHMPSSDPYTIGQSNWGADTININLWVHNNSNCEAVKVRLYPVMYSFEALY
jgi:hypothetical protein